MASNQFTSIIGTGLYQAQTFVLIRFFLVSIGRESRSRLVWGRSIKINFFSFFDFQKKSHRLPLATISHHESISYLIIFTAALQMKLTVRCVCEIGRG